MIGLSEAQAVQRMRQLVQRVKDELNLQAAPCYEGINNRVAQHLGVQVREAALPFNEGPTGSAACYLP